MGDAPADLGAAAISGSCAKAAKEVLSDYKKLLL